MGFQAKGVVVIARCRMRVCMCVCAWGVGISQPLARPAMHSRRPEAMHARSRGAPFRSMRGRAAAQVRRHRNGSATHDHGDGPAGAAGPRRPPDPVHVVLGADRQVVVHLARDGRLAGSGQGRRRHKGRRRRHNKNALATQQEVVHLGGGRRGLAGSEQGRRRRKIEGGGGTKEGSGDTCTEEGSGDTHGKGGGS